MRFAVGRLFFDWKRGFAVEENRPTGKRKKTFRLGYPGFRLEADTSDGAVSRMDSSGPCPTPLVGSRILSSTYFLLMTMYGRRREGQHRDADDAERDVRSEKAATAHAVSATRASALLDQQIRPGPERLAGRIRRSCLAKHAGSCLPA